MSHLYLIEEIKTLIYEIVVDIKYTTHTGTTLISVVIH